MQDSFLMAKFSSSCTNLEIYTYVEKNAFLSGMIIAFLHQTVLIFAIDAKSEDFPGIRKVFCCGKIPIKTSKKSKIAQKIFGGPCFSGPGGSIGPPVPVTWEPLKQ